MCLAMQCGRRIWLKARVDFAEFVTAAYGAGAASTAGDTTPVSFDFARLTLLT